MGYDSPPKVARAWSWAGRRTKGDTTNARALNYVGLRDMRRNGREDVAFHLGAACARACFEKTLVE